MRNFRAEDMRPKPKPKPAAKVAPAAPKFEKKSKKVEEPIAAPEPEPVVVEEAAPEVVEEA